MTDAVIYSAISTNILWTDTVSTLSYVKYVKTMKAMTTLDATMITTISTEAVYGVFLDYAHIGFEIFCTDNGLNIGEDDYMTTGTCNCVADATAEDNEISGIPTCLCDTDYTMITGDDGKSCATGQLTFCF